MFEEMKTLEIEKKDVETALEKGKGEAVAVLQDEKKTDTLIKKAMKICEQLSRIPVVGDFFAEVPLACMFVQDFVKGNYREVPLATIFSVAGAICYLVLPVDLIPDFIPVIGYLDDAKVFSMALGAAHNDLMVYAQWKEYEPDTLLLE